MSLPSAEEFAEICVENGECGAQMELERTHAKGWDGAFLRESLIRNIAASARARDKAVALAVLGDLQDKGLAGAEISAAIGFYAEKLGKGETP